MEYNASWMWREYQKVSLRATIKVDVKSLATWYMVYINYPTIYQASQTSCASQAWPNIVLTRTQVILV